MTNGLSTSQFRRLKSLEAQITKGASEIYEALRAIHDEKLYLANHDTFEDYCRERWGMGRQYAHRLLQHGQVLRLTDEQMSPIGDTESSETAEKPHFSSSDVLRESHTREVAGLPKSEQVTILKEAIETATRGSDGKPRVTAEHVRTIRDSRDQELPPPPSRESDDAGGAGDSGEKSPEQLFREQRSRTVKTAESLIRALGDLNAIRKKPLACDALKQRVYSVIEEVNEW